MSDLTAGFLMVGALIVVYFVPAIFAILTKHRAGAAIVVVNLFLGWTLIGWVIALAWAVYNPEAQCGSKGDGRQ